MRWTTLFSILFCAVNFVLAFALLAIISYNLMMTSTKEDRFPISVMTEWREYLIQLIPVMVYIIMASVVSCWAVTRRKKPGTAATVMILHIIALGLSLFYCCMIYSLIGAAQIQSEELKQRTLELFQSHAETTPGDNHWVPVWLIEVQSQSNTCCGIVTYEDWRDFWPENPDEVPESCCRQDRRCITNVAKIEWPDIPFQYIKNDEGCSREVAETVKKRIFEAVKFLITLSAFLVVSMMIFVFQYTAEFFFPFVIPDDSNEPPRKSIAHLTVGETWARMGFGKSKREKAPINSDTLELLQISTQPGSYTDMYLQQLETMSSANQVISSPNLPLTNSSNVKNNPQGPQPSLVTAFGTKFLVTARNSQPLNSPGKLTSSELRDITSDLTDNTFSKPYNNNNSSTPNNNQPTMSSSKMQKRQNVGLLGKYDR